MRGHHRRKRFRIKLLVAAQNTRRTCAPSLELPQHAAAGRDRVGCAHAPNASTCCALASATSRLMASILTGFLATLRRAAISCCRICRRHSALLACRHHTSTAAAASPRAAPVLAAVRATCRLGRHAAATRITHTNAATVCIPIPSDLDRPHCKQQGAGAAETQQPWPTLPIIVNAIPT